MISTTIIIIGLVISMFGLASIIIAAVIITALWSAQTVKEYKKDRRKNDG